MAHRKYTIGEMVDYMPARAGIPVPSSEYKVVRVMPSEGREQLYRIKSPDEAFERVAKEHELGERELS